MESKYSCCKRFVTVLTLCEKRSHDTKSKVLILRLKSKFSTLNEFCYLSITVSHNKISSGSGADNSYSEILSRILFHDFSVV